MNGYELSQDGMTLMIWRLVPGGWHVATLHRQLQAGPFTDADIAVALARVPAPGGMLPGQRNRTHRTETRVGVVWTHLMLGPPTWWLPLVRRSKDGTVMAGWLRLAVAVKLDREEKLTMADAVSVPDWVAALTDSVRASGLPTAILADAMRARGEDPRDEALWRVRIDQLDTALFGCPVRELGETDHG